ncbi:MAG: prepilin-type N-terminal cleavage/methylation domain-containing protein [Candidatus Omnitrophica bacterium]|nr:prepilin-type N-terminal cleavage/methylation domain-containing protein [Candidatus Omnitrophota bacterium]
MKDATYIIKAIKKLDGQRAITLVEVLITVLIFSGIVGGILAVFLAGSQSWEVNKVKIEIQEDLRLALASIENDLQQASASSIIDVPADDGWYSVITFRVPEAINSDGRINWPGETISYYVDGDGNGRLIREIEDSGTVQSQRIIAENVSTFEVRRQSTDFNVVDINLQTAKDPTVGSPQSTSTVLRVYLRN